MIYTHLVPEKNLAAKCAFGIFVSLITTIMTYSFITNRGNHHFGISHIYLTVYKSKVPYKRSKRCLDHACFNQDNDSEQEQQQTEQKTQLTLCLQKTFDLFSEEKIDKETIDSKVRN